MYWSKFCGKDAGASLGYRLYYSKGAPPYIGGANCFLKQESQVESGNKRHILILSKPRAFYDGIIQQSGFGGSSAAPQDFQPSY